jgi:RNA polymerase sigma-70 factor (ECF subfamily)
MAARKTAEEIYSQKYLEIENALRAYVVSQVGNLNDADDIVRDVCMVMWEKLGEYKPEIPFMRWAIGIVRHKIMHHRRSLARSHVLFDDNLSKMLAQKVGCRAPTEGR